MSVTFGAAFTVRFYSWTDWKAVQAARSLQTQYNEEPSRYTIYGYDGPEVHESIVEKTTPPNADQTDFEANYKPTANQSIDPRTSDGKPINLLNQFPGDVIPYFAGAADVPGGNRGEGAQFNLGSDAAGDTVLDFTFNDWIYLLGGNLIMSGGDIDDWINYLIFAPPTPVTPNPGAGNCDLVDPGVGAPILIVPNGGGTGSDDVNLADTFPVPAVDDMGKPIGYYDWDDPDEGKGAITVGAPGASFWNLYTIQIDIVNYVARQPLLGDCDVPINPPVKPKKLLPFWTHRVTLHNSGHAGLKAAWSLTTARKTTTN
jgi:hypothetical protein